MEEVDLPETQYAAANGLKIAYETFGSSSDAPILMVMGLGTQMIAWPDEMCQQIADRGFYVIRFDNRDVGLSTHLDELPTPTRSDLLLRRKPPKLVAVALANKIARIAWKLMVTGETYQAGAAFPCCGICRVKNRRGGMA